jgi:hypothetical protein
MSSTAPRIPRSRPAIIPVGRVSLWLRLPGAVRVAVSMAVVAAGGAAMWWML